MTRMDKSLPVFDLSGTASQVSERWKKWLRAFTYYVEGKGIDNPSRRRSMLLHFAGMEVQELFEHLTDPSPGVEDDDTFKEAVRKLNSHFTAEQNTPYERHVFRQLAPNAGETTDQFVMRLRQQAQYCAFTDSQEHVRDQLIEKTPHLELRKKLLEKKNVTLLEALQIARAWESAAAQATSMSMPVVTPVPPTVSHVDRGKSSSPGRVCFNCGRTGHMAKDRVCPARDRTCNTCGVRGHFSVRCKTSSSMDRQSWTTEGRAGGRGRRNDYGRRTAAGHNVRTVAEPNEDVGDESDFVFSVSECANLSSRRHEPDMCPHMDVSIGGLAVRVLIDSGSVCNLLGEKELEQMLAQGWRVTRRPCERELYAYGGRKLDVVCSFVTNVCAGKVKVPAEFIVVKQAGKCLLGFETAQQLGVLSIHRQPVNAIDARLDTSLTRQVEEEYPELFKGVGKLRDYQLELHVNESIPAVAQKPRRVPFALREQVTKKVEELIEHDIVERVQGPTTWASPIVVEPKPSGDIRLCVDMRRANEAIIRERIPMPTVDEVLEEMNGSKVYSKLDLNWGFHQIELEPGSRDITTFATHDGLFRYKRLSFGINSAPEKFQQIVRQVLAGCEGALNIADDIIVHGKDQAEHDMRLFKVLRRLQEKGLTLGLRKCRFRLDKVEFMGLLLSRYGIGPTDAKVKAVVEATRPETTSEVRSFLGLVGFSARFISDFATIAEPLRALTRHGAHFTWGAAEERAFIRLKDKLTKAPTLAYFDKSAHTQVIADASPVGLGAVLVQDQDGVKRAVAYTSRALSAVERRYSQTEKEALALVWACERFHLYLYGLPKFDLVTDHKALEFIYSARSKPSARVERWVLRLQSYNFQVCYVPSAKNIADALSRLLTSDNASTCIGNDEQYVRAVAQAAVPHAMRIQDIESASGSDKELQAVRHCLKSGDYQDMPKSFMPVREELTFVGHVILRGTRIVIPQQLRDHVINLAHEGHQGVVKTKSRLRSKVWWPGMDRDAESKCRSCHGCQLVGQPEHPEPLKSTKLPDGPWQELAVDLLGPLPSGDSLLVLVDYYSRYMEVDVLRSTTSQVVICRLDAQFARHGIPIGLRTDNGPQFVSEEFVQYLSQMGIKHRRTTPLWPQANGEVERQNRSLLKVLKIAQVEHRDWRQALNTFLLAYRSTPHSTTGSTPAELLYHRKIRTKLPSLDEEELVDSDQSVVDRDRELKQKMRDSADKARDAQESDLVPGTTVLVRQPRVDKLSTLFSPEPFVVSARHGSQLTLTSPQGVQYRRNLAHVKRYHHAEQNSPALPVKPTEVDEVPQDRPQHVMEEVAPVPFDKFQDEVEESKTESPSEVLRRSGRVRREPTYLKDYVCK